MGSFEWMELQTLTSDINAARSRLAAARANKDNRLIRNLEVEITEAEVRRDRLLASITTNLAASGEAAHNPAAAQAAEAVEPAQAVAEPDADSSAAEPAAAEASGEPEEAPGEPEEAPGEPEEAPGEPEEAPGEPVDRPAADERATPVAVAQADSVEGGMVVWDQLTPSDIQRALAAIGERRDEILARHVEELKALEVEQAELEGLEKAIDAFVRRLSKAEPTAAEATASAA